MTGFLVNIHKLDDVALWKRVLIGIPKWRTFSTLEDTTDNSEWLYLTNKNKEEYKFVWNLVTLLGVALVIILTINVTHEWSSFWRWVLAIFMTSHWMQIVKGMSYIINMPAQISRWHGCEHKLIYLYNNGIPRTYDNLVAAPKESKGCGTRATGGGAVLLVVVFVLLHFSSHDIGVLASFGLIFVGLIVYTFLGERISMFLQKRWNTKEPDALQIKHALELALRIDAELNINGLYHTTIKSA